MDKFFKKILVLTVVASLSAFAIAAPKVDEKKQEEEPSFLNKVLFFTSAGGLMAGGWYLFYKINKFYSQIEEYTQQREFLEDIKNDFHNALNEGSVSKEYYDALVAQIDERLDILNNKEDKLRDDHNRSWFNNLIGFFGGGTGGSGTRTIPIQLSQETMIDEHLHRDTQTNETNTEEPIMNDGQTNSLSTAYTTETQEQQSDNPEEDFDSVEESEYVPAYYTTGHRAGYTAEQHIGRLLAAARSPYNLGWEPIFPLNFVFEDPDEPGIDEDTREYRQWAIDTRMFDERQAHNIRTRENHERHLAEQRERDQKYLTPMSKMSQSPQDDDI